MKNQDVTINSPNTQLATYYKTIDGLNGNEIANVQYVNSQTSSSMNVYWTYSSGVMKPANYNILVPSPLTTTFQIPPSITNTPVYSTDAVNKFYVDNSFNSNSLWIYMQQNIG